ncbi:MAG: hypothetical protein K8R35_11260 [Bacteroidales bacterium]|nr:hypothetical protein [Bacteroidales bacterium]
MNNTVNSPEQNINPVNKNKTSGLFVIAAILGTILVAMIILFFVQRHNMIEMKTILTEEKDSLTNELVMLLYGYDTLKTNNDTLNAKLEAEKIKIERLLAINASNTQTIRTYRKEITTMRQIMKSYIVQIDSLNTRNKILIAENLVIKQQINRVERTNLELSKVKEELSSKVEIASVIQAKNIICQTLNKKRKETERLDRMINLRICFTLRENPIAEAGKKVVFIRVARPDGLIITKSPDNIFEAGEETFIFTENRTVDYLNQDVEMCIFVDNNGDFIKGNYTIDLYLEGEKIGSGSFMLK